MIEGCFQNAKECEEKAQTIDEGDVRAFYRTLAEQWRRLALIVAKHPSKYDECATRPRADDNHCSLRMNSASIDVRFWR